MTTTPLQRRMLSLVAVAALGAGVVSCADQPQDTAMTDLDGVAVTAGANQPAEVNGVDLHFVAMMTQHHQQAVDMSELNLTAEATRSATDDLYQRIQDAQQQDI